MDAGLRGYQVGGAQVSEKHCGFVINKGNATAADVLYIDRECQGKGSGAVWCNTGTGSEIPWRILDRTGDKSMRFVIVTGVSGAGKTAALKMLEDANYFCVDNLPIPLLEKFASLMPEIHGEDVQNVALGIDARSGTFPG